MLVSSLLGWAILLSQRRRPITKHGIEESLDRSKKEYRHRAANLERCRYLLGVVEKSEAGTLSPVAANDESQPESWEERMLRLTGVDPRLCPA